MQKGLPGHLRQPAGLRRGGPGGPGAGGERGAPGLFSFFGLIVCLFIYYGIFLICII